MSVRLWTKWLWVRVQLQSLNLQILRLLRTRSPLTFRQLQSVNSSRNAYVTWEEHIVKFKRFLLKYYPNFSTVRKIGEYLSQFLMLLYYCVSSLSKFLSINKLLKNDSVPQLKMGKISTTPLYCTTTNPKKFFDEKRT